MRHQVPPRPLKRDGMWYLIRRVPAEFAHLDRRRLVRISTGIAVADDPRAVRAAEAVRHLYAELCAYWRGLADGQSAEVRIRYDAAQRRAQRLGFQYKTAAELAEGPLTEILDRLRSLTDREKVEEELEVTAVLGGEERPVFKVSDLPTQYESLARSGLAALSDDQRRKWRNRLNLATENFVNLIGDKPIADLTRSDALAFRAWWQDRLAAEDLDIDTANKNLGSLRKMFETVNNAHDLGLKAVFTGLRIAGAVTKRRAAFAPEFVQDRILVPGALGDLNEEAADILRVVADTGLRLSEVCNLLPARIHLGGKIPYVEIRADGRKLKTPDSERDIPLVGVALAAMKRHPNGYPRYRDKSASLSALVNKVLDQKGLLPTAKHSLYSLRHTFEDRLTAIETPEKVVSSLMGHKWIRPKYGVGPSLALKHKWLSRIAYRVL